MYICTSVFVSFKTSNIQHGVRIEAVFTSLQGEHTHQIHIHPAYILQAEFSKEEGKRYPIIFLSLQYSTRVATSNPQNATSSSASLDQSQKLHSKPKKVLQFSKKFHCTFKEKLHSNYRGHSTTVFPWIEAF